VCKATLFDSRIGESNISSCQNDGVFGWQATYGSALGAVVDPTYPVPHVGFLGLRMEELLL
jgi:hypothetical protein